MEFVVGKITGIKKYVLLFQFIFLLILLNVITSQESLSEMKDQSEAICEDPEVKKFSLTTLGYITPWNDNGIFIALKYANKFDIISPCWFLLKTEIFNGKFNVKVYNC